MGSRPIIGVALLFTLFFAGLTLYVIVRTGLDVLTLASLFVLVLFGVGLYGAFTQPPQE
jgi:hypothetical protein